MESVDIIKFQVSKEDAKRTYPSNSWDSDIRPVNENLAILVGGTRALF